MLTSIIYLQHTQLYMIFLKQNLCLLLADEVLFAFYMLSVLPSKKSEYTHPVLSPHLSAFYFHKYILK